VNQPQQAPVLAAQSQGLLRSNNNNSSIHGQKPILSASIPSSNSSPRAPPERAHSADTPEIESWYGTTRPPQPQTTAPIQSLYGKSTVGQNVFQNVPASNSPNEIIYGVPSPQTPPTSTGSLNKSSPQTDNIYGTMTEQQQKGSPTKGLTRDASVRSVQPTNNTPGQLSRGSSVKSSVSTADYDDERPLEQPPDETQDVLIAEVGIYLFNIKMHLQIKTGYFIIYYLFILFYIYFFFIISFVLTIL
jgi:hypothetical protein